MLAQDLREPVGQILQLRMGMGGVVVVPGQDVQRTAFRLLVGHIEEGGLMPSPHRLSVPLPHPDPPHMPHIPEGSGLGVQG